MFTCAFMYTNVYTRSLYTRVYKLTYKLLKIIPARYVTSPDTHLSVVV
jgi:hypothetical protein